jgi:hypothetical protein
MADGRRNKSDIGCEAAQEGGFDHAVGARANDTDALIPDFLAVANRAIPDLARSQRRFMEVVWHLVGPAICDSGGQNHGAR